MKKLLLAGVALATMSFTACNSNASGKVDESKKEIAEQRDAQPQAYPVMDFEASEHDFGTVNEGDIVEHTFIFTNTGDAPLIISDASASCGCTVPTYTKEPIAPGDKGEMVVKFNTRGKPNQQMKAVRIVANTQSGRETIRIKAFVNPQNSNAGSPVR